MKYTTIWFFSVCWNFTLVWIIIIWWNIWIFDSFSYSEILMLLNHYTYLKNLMTMILYILYEMLAFNKSLHIFEKFDDLILFYHLKYFFLCIIIFFWNFNKFDSLHIHEIYFYMNHYELLKYKFMILFASLWIIIYIESFFSPWNMN